MTALVADVDDVLDYEWDFTAFLASGETIATAVITASADLTLNPSPHGTSHTSTTVTAWVTGGVPWTIYSLGCHITTSAGRERDQELRLLVTTLATGEAGSPPDDDGTIDGGTP